MSVLGVDIKCFLLKLTKVLTLWWSIKFCLVIPDLFNLLWKGLHHVGVGDVVLVVVDLDQVLSTDGLLVCFVNVNVGSLLIGGQNELVIYVERSWIVKNHSQMLGSLHVVLASVTVTADVGNLLVFLLEVVLLSLVEVILVLVVFIRILVILMFFGKLENYLMFQICHVVGIVWINDHELIIIGHVVVLFDLFLSTVHDDFNLLLLDQELWVLMLKEWRKVLVFPCLSFIFILQKLDISHLELVETRVGGVVRIGSCLWIELKFVDAEGVDGEESDILSVWFLDVANVLDSFSQDLVLS